MQSATATPTRTPARRAYTADHVRGRILAELGFVGVQRADIDIVRCDDLPSVYAARVCIHFGPTFEHPTANAVYLIWRDRSGEEHLRTIVHPSDVHNIYIDVRSVCTAQGKVVISCGEHCGLGAMQTKPLVRKIPIVDLAL